MDRIVGVAGAADMLELSESRIRQLIAEGRLPAQRAGRNFAIFESDVFALADREHVVGRPAVYAVRVIPGESVAHLATRATGQTFCGRFLPLGIDHPIGPGHDLTGLLWCSECRGKAPRHLLRYYSSRGIR